MPEEKERKADLDHDNTADVEERVRQMMDPGVKDKSDVDAPAILPDPTTAPEVIGMPVSKEPLKIKILKDGEIASKPTKTDNPPTEADVPPPLGDDAATATAVDDIVSREGDELLAIYDDKTNTDHHLKPSGFRAKLAHFFRSWWSNPTARWTTIIVLLLAVVVAATVPQSRYFVLNTAGVRGSLSVQVLDESTLQPLKNVEVSAGGVQTLTDTDGHAKLEKVRLGPTELVIDKRAFAFSSRAVTIGWGSNPQGEVQLKPVGAQYAFKLTDFLSGRGIAKVEAISGDASALSDGNGLIKLTLDEPPDEFEVSISGQGYREEIVKVNATSKDELSVPLVPARPHVFVSKRSGNLDVYRIDLDGKNEARVLPGTGTERDDMTIIVHPTEAVAAVVSTRENKRNADGFLLSTLTLIDLKNNTAKAVTTSERVQLVDWSGDRLVYVQIAAGSSASNPKRHRLLSYDHKTTDQDEIAATNYFNDVLIAAGKVYYAPSGAHQAGTNIGLFQVDADGQNRQVLIAKEVWNLFRTAHDQLTIAATGNEWYTYRLGDGKPTTGSQLANQTSRIYQDSPDAKTSLWTDERDGKGVLLAYDLTKKEDRVLHTESGLKTPIRWVTNRTAIYRIKTEQQTADYAISLDGGNPRKISDVTNTAGADQWYYY